MMFSLCALKVAVDIRIVIVGLYSTHRQILVPPRSCFEVQFYPPPFLTIWGGSYHNHARDYSTNHIIGSNIFFITAVTEHVISSLLTSNLKLTSLLTNLIIILITGDPKRSINDSQIYYSLWGSLFFDQFSDLL